MFRHVPLILGNAVRNLRRSVITIASIGVSLCLLGILLAIYLGLFHAPDTSPAQALRVIVRHRVSLTRDLPISYLPKIRAVHGVKAVTSWQWFGGTYIEPKNFFARFGVDPKEFFEVYPDFEVTPEARDAFQQQRTACLAGEALAKKFKWQPNQRITLKGDIFPVNLELTMVGTFNDPDGGQLLLFNNQYLRDGLSGPRKDRVGTFMLTVNSPERVPGLSKEIDAMFANSPEPTRTESEKQFALSFVGFMGNLRLFLGAISGAVLFAILLVSANTIASTAASPRIIPITSSGV